MRSEATNFTLLLSRVHSDELSLPCSVGGTPHWCPVTCTVPDRRQISHGTLRTMCFGVALSIVATSNGLLF